MKKEPAITIGSVTALVGALLYLLVQFGVPLTEGQQDAINGVALVVAPIVAGVIIRRFVSPANAPDSGYEPTHRREG